MNNQNIDRGPQGKVPDRRALHSINEYAEKFMESKTTVDELIEEVAGKLVTSSGEEKNKLQEHLALLKNKRDQLNGQLPKQ